MSVSFCVSRHSLAKRECQLDPRLTPEMKNQVKDIYQIQYGHFRDFFKSAHRDQLLGLAGPSEKLKSKKDVQIVLDAFADYLKAEQQFEPYQERELAFNLTFPIPVAREPKMGAEMERKNAEQAQRIESWIQGPRSVRDAARKKFEELSALHQIQFTYPVGDPISFCCPPSHREK
jgi:hypothetical protein